MIYQNNQAGRAAALAAAHGDQSRLWFDGDTIRLMDVFAATVPAAVTPAQAKIALLRAGKLVAVQSAVDAAGGEAKIWWDESLSIDRAHPLVQALGAAAGLSAADLDALFIAAAQIA